MKPLLTLLVLVLVLTPSVLGTTVSYRPATGTDDVECRWDFYYDSNNLQNNLGAESTPPNNNYDTAIRFPSVTIPVGANITNAYITFTASTTNSGGVTLNLTAQTGDNPPTFPTSDSACTAYESLTHTNTMITWSPSAWTATNTYTSPNLSTIIQEVIEQGTWDEGDAIVLFSTDYSSTPGTFRRYRTYEYNSNAASANLTIEYEVAATDCELDNKNIVYSILCFIGLCQYEGTSCERTETRPTTTQAYTCTNTGCTPQ